MDIEALYTNIPNEDGLLALKQFIYKHHLKIDTTTVIRLAKLVLSMNSFQFMGQHYKQKKGVAMGTKMGSSYACLFVGYVEEKIFIQYTEPLPDLFKRYIDDCMGVTSRSMAETLQFIHFISSFHPSLRFTHEISEESVPFLNIQYPPKPTLTNSILPSTTSPPTPTLTCSFHQAILTPPKTATHSPNFCDSVGSAAKTTTSPHRPKLWPLSSHTRDTRKTSSTPLVLKLRPQAKVKLCGIKLTELQRTSRSCVSRIILTTSPSKTFSSETSTSFRMTQY